LKQIEHILRSTLAIYFVHNSRWELAIKDLCEKLSACDDLNRELPEYGEGIQHEPL
jgi:hypothetical protein